MQARERQGNCVISKNCVALNSSISGGGGRVIGSTGSIAYGYGKETMTNNYALSTLPSTEIGHNKKDGADVTVTDATAKTIAFWTTSGNWSGGVWPSDVWTFTAGSNPALKPPPISP